MISCVDDNHNVSGEASFLTVWAENVWGVEVVSLTLWYSVADDEAPLTEQPVWKIKSG